MAKAPIKKQTAPSLVDRISKLSSGVQCAIVVASVAIVGIAFYMLFYTPYSLEVEKLEQNISSLNQNISEKRTSIAKHNKVKALQEPIDLIFNQMASYLPQETEMSRLVQMVADIASRAGLADGVTMFQPKLPAIIKENYAEIPFTVDLNGEFLTILAFLYDFSKMDRIVNITDFSIGSPKMVDDKRNILHVSVKCSGSTYRTLTKAEMDAKKDTAKK